MPLPHDALVLVADGRKMLFFRNHGDENQIDLGPKRTTRGRIARTARSRPTRPARTKQSFGYGRSTYEETDFHQQEEDRWIKDAADELKKRVLRNDFEALAIVAPPKALGVLKKCLHKEVERRIVCTVNKEMSGRPIPDIEALLVGETQADIRRASAAALVPRLHHRPFDPRRSPSSSSSFAPARSSWSSTCAPSRARAPIPNIMPTRFRARSPNGRSATTGSPSSAGFGAAPMTSRRK